MNSKNYLVFGLVVLLSASVETKAQESCCDQSGKQVCSSVKECSDVFIKRAAESRDETSVNVTDTDIAFSFQRLGREAVPTLLQFLKSQDKRTRDLAGCVLRDQPGLTGVDLDALIEAEKAAGRGGSWLPPAIARIGSPKAVAFLIEELKREKDVENQIGFALKILGEKAVPALVEIVNCGNTCDEQLVWAVAATFRELGTASVGAVPKLTEISKNKNTSIAARVGAIRCLGAIGPAASSVGPALLIIAATDRKNFQTAVTDALKNMKSVAAVDGLVQRLESASNQHERIMVFRDLAEMGRAAQAAGPKVSQYLSSDDWDLRAHAARTLGYIGNPEVAAELRKALLVKNDWRLNYIAAFSLGKLNDRASLAELRSVSTQHWYSLVRKAAAESAHRIENQQPAEEKQLSGANFYIEYFSVQATAWDLPQCKLPAGEKAVVKLQVKDGEFIATDRGEWGGSLIFVSKKNAQKEKLLEQNVSGLVQRGQNIFAFTGLAHMGTDYGRIYLVHRRNEEQAWAVSPFLELPGDPAEIIVLQNGDVVINTYVRGPVITEHGQQVGTTALGGAVRFAVDGTLSTFICSE